MSKESNEKINFGASVPEVKSHEQLVIKINNLYNYILIVFVAN